jgi:hypothetical protein
MLSEGFNFMNQIDKEIMELEEKLQKLKEQKKYIENKDLLISPPKEELEIIIYNFDNDEEKHFSNFKDMFSFLKKKMKKNDKIALDYRKNHEIVETTFDELNEEDEYEIMSLIASFDAYQIYSMEFGIINRKEIYDYMVTIKTPFLNELQYAVENKYHVENFDEIMAKSKDWRLF